MIARKSIVCERGRDRLTFSPPARCHTAQAMDMFQAKHRKADSEAELEYQSMMAQALAESGFTKVERSTHGWIHELLETLPEAVKKSAHYAVDNTSADDSNASLDSVYQFQTRSADPHPVAEYNPRIACCYQVDHSASFRGVCVQA